MQNRHYLLWGLSVALSVIPIIKVEAQLIPDNTLGKENSVINTVDLLQIIDGGAIRGYNLFHSFKEFNIDNGKSVYFNNPTAIKNILTRVTGKNSSAIFGKLGVLGNGNLFLINPNGIIFGENASLDISGSFTATTLPSILFDNGFEFSATNLEESPLLKVNIIPGLQYPRTPQGDIGSKANLTVGEDLNLIGKNINLTGDLRAGRDLNLKAASNLQIRDSSDVPFIADAGNNLLLEGTENLNIFASNHPDSSLFSGNDLILKGANPVLSDINYLSGRNFRIEQPDGSLGSLQSNKNSIIRTRGNVSFDSYTGASLHILAGGSVNITGDVTITNVNKKNTLEETIALSTGDKLEINGNTQPTLDIRAGTTKFGNAENSENIKLKPENSNTEEITSSSNIFIDGNIEIKQKNGLVFLSNNYSRNPNLSVGNIQIQGHIDTSTDAGNGGDIIIDSLGNVDITNYIKTDSTYNNNADAGDILINAAENITVSNDIKASSLAGSSGRISLSSKDRLSIIDGAIIESESNRNNIGGDDIIGADIKLSASAILLEDNSQVVAIIGGSGKAGNLIIEAEKVEINNGSILGSISGNIQSDNDSAISATTGNGEAGGIIINAQDFVRISDNSKITSEAKSTGTAGFIDINTNNLNITNSSVASVNSKQEAGYILVDADNIIIDNLSKVTAETISGVSGNIEFKNLQTLQLSEKSLISATTIDGKAGNIAINSTDEVKIAQGSKIASGAVGKGEAGFLEIITNKLNISDNSDAVVSSVGKGNAGFISIKANDVNLTNKATISASTVSGDAGDIKLNNLKTLFLSQHSFINATTIDGNAGNIKIDATDSITVENNSKLASKAVRNGVAGNIDIVTNQLNIIDNSQINVSSQGNGNSISVLVRENDVLPGNNIAAAPIRESIDDNVTSGNSNILEFSNSLRTVPNINQVAGGTSINPTDSVKPLDNNIITSKPRNNGIAGGTSINPIDSVIPPDNNIITSKPGNNVIVDGTSINITDSVRPPDNNIITSKPRNNGIPGELVVTPDRFTLTDSQANISSQNSGVSGDILINANDLNLSQNSKIFATTESGEGGNITLNNLNNLSVNNSEISASTVDGIGGNLTINATESINLTGKGGLLVKASNAGTAGYIEANTNKFNILDESQINVSSKLGQAGYLQITANNLFLNQGKLTAETGIGKGSRSGTINLNIQDLLTLENNSLISAKAFANANGGNITINNSNGFVIGLPSENSDIIANANKGNGGNIEITTQNIIGLGFRPEITPKSDITASSKFGISGQLTLNQSHVDPSFTLIDLPSTVSQEAKIQPGCAASAGNNFIISGKGGLPQNPNNLFSGNAILVGLVDLVISQTASTSSINSKNSTIITVDNQKNQIIEATGWIKDSNNNIIFVAKTPQATSQNSRVSSSCQNFSAKNKI